MTSDGIAQLYPEAIRSHQRDPRHTTLPENATSLVSGDNPLCGDAITLGVWLVEGTIEDVGHQTRGCALCVASASMMCSTVIGKTIADAQQADAAFRHLIQTGKAAASMGELDEFGGVASFPARRQCALLPWNVLSAALKERGE